MQKSLTQMDLKTARRRKKLAIVRVDCQMPRRSQSRMELGEQAIKARTKTQQYRSSVPYGRSLVFLSYKFYNAAMCRIWRQQRSRRSKLWLEAETEKQKVTKTNNNVHVISTVFRNEQKHNESLKQQIEEQHQKYQLFASECQNLTAANIDIRMNMELLAETVNTQMLQIEELSRVVNQTKSHVFQFMAKERNMQAELSNQQRVVQNLKTENSDLLQNLADAVAAGENTQTQLSTELLQKSEKINQTKEIVKLLRNKLLMEENTNSDDILSACRDREADLSNNLQQLTAELEQLHKLHYNWFAKLIRYSGMCCHVIGHAINFSIYYTMPLTTPPKLSAIPIGMPFKFSNLLLKLSK